MQSFTKVINPGSVHAYDGLWAKVYIKIKYREADQCVDDDDKLSIVGVVGPLQSGNALGSCGQIQDELFQIEMFEDGWDANSVYDLNYVWKHWHLNDLHAGTMLQEQLVDKYFKDNNIRYDYQVAYDFLKSIEMHKHLGVHYGYKWNHWPVPEYILEWLYNLPETKTTPAWV